jgi:hypothetical protein
MIRVSADTQGASSVDGQRFDELTRLFAESRTRRSVLRGMFGLAGAAAGALGVRGADAASCRDLGDICRKPGDCCTGACGPKDAAGRQRCVCPPGLEECGGACIDPTTYLEDLNNCGACGVSCPAPEACHVAVCDAGVCGTLPDPAAVGQPCDDGDLCTENDVCQADGSCAGTPKDCAVDHPCQIGSCDASSGNCIIDVTTMDGEPCDDGNLCSSSSVCAMGVCEGQDPVTCVPLDQCHVAGVCDGSTGECSNPEAARGTPCSDGNPLCVDGECCPAENRCVDMTGQPVCCPSGETCASLEAGPVAVGV